MSNNKYLNQKILDSFFMEKDLQFKLDNYIKINASYYSLSKMLLLNFFINAFYLVINCINSRIPISNFILMTLLITAI